MKVYLLLQYSSVSTPFYVFPSTSSTGQTKSENTEEMPGPTRHLIGIFKDPEAAKRRIKTLCGYPEDFVIPDGLQAWDNSKHSYGIETWEVEG